MTFEQFFNSEIKARLVKFFIYNNSKFFDIGDIAKRLALRRSVIKPDLLELRDQGFLKSRSSKAFSVSYKFPHLNDIKNLALRFP